MAKREIVVWFDNPDICVSPDISIRQAIVLIDRNSKGIVLVTDKTQRLLATITDGDIRRAILDGEDLGQPLSKLMAYKAKGRMLHCQPVVAANGTDPEILLKLMKKHGVRHIPLVDGDRRVVNLVTMDDLLPDQMASLQAVIMAGGFGTRLHPLTEEMPKPMLPVGDRPLMEFIVEQLREAGIRKVNVTTHYKAEKIMEHFGNGDDFGIELNYINEDQPMGTAGALGLMPESDQPMLVINGDILTQVNFRAMLAYHQEHQAEVTVGVRHYEIQVPYGVVECDGPNIYRLQEKPTLSLFVNAGIYLLEPSVYQFMPNGKPFSMTDLIQWLLEARRPLVSFPIREYWLDVGQHIDYHQAQKDVTGMRLKV